MVEVFEVKKPLLSERQSQRVVTCITGGEAAVTLATRVTAQ